MDILEFDTRNGQRNCVRRDDVRAHLDQSRRVTGDLGGGLARQWSRAGYTIVIGSRTLEKGQEAAAALLTEFPDLNVTGLDNPAAAEQADLVVLTVPFAHQLSTLDSVKHALIGKVLIDVTVPLVPPKVGTVQMPASGSAGQQAQDHLGEDVFVVSAFQNVGAMHLQEDHSIACDVLVTGNKRAARDTVITLIEALGLKGEERVLEIVEPIQGQSGSKHIRRIC